MARDRYIPHPKEDGVLLHGEERKINWYPGHMAKTLRLLTNNPDKVYQLSDFGMAIKERVPIQVPANAHDLFYLRTKQEKMGHILNY